MGVGKPVFNRSLERGLKCLVCINTTPGLLEKFHFLKEKIVIIEVTSLDTDNI